MKLHPKGTEEMKPLPNAEVKVGNSAKPKAPDAVKVGPDSKLQRRLPPNAGKGRPKGAKNKSTLLNEAANVATAAIVAKIKTAPLEVLIGFMEKAQEEYAAAEAAAKTELALPEPGEEDVAGRRRRQDVVSAVKRARANAIECAIAAAPYCHSKLQSVDKTVKKGVVIQVKKYEFVAPKPASKAGK